MASVSVGNAGSAGIGDRLLARVAEQGSAAHPYPASAALLKGPDAARNLSDVVHFLCTLHGRYPGVIDHAADRSLEAGPRAWLAAARQAFAVERAFLARLAVAAGPIPSTPGSAESEAAVLGQRHAVEMLARSERNGCALGAAAAVALDWAAIRPVLDAAGRRFGIESPVFQPVGPPDLGETTAVERALMFGAEQILVQHFGLWELLEARQQARAGS
jgi:hypothetical protein